MATKPQPSASNSAPAAPSKQPRSRKAATAADVVTAGRAGSAGGVVLERENPKKPSKLAAADPKEAQPKRKPRKLNKEPSTAVKDTSVPSASTEVKELEALKSRVRGLEAKVEELYKSTPSVGAGAGGGGAAARSPRRRGKGRKNSSATTTATLSGLAKEKETQSPNQVPSLDDEEEAEKELGRLEDELETARQDLALFHPSTSTSSGQNPRPRARRATADEGEEVEEVPRERPAVERPGVDRQVTLSGSYRIPLPASLNPEDVRTIQSGVAAARDVARSFLDQRRAGRGAPTDGGASTGAKPQKKRAQEGEGSEGARETEGGKVGWGEWIGGYSVAISRAVKSIEHEAAMEAQRPGGGSGRAGAEGGKRGKRPGAKTALSGEQIEGLMG